MKYGNPGRLGWGRPDTRAIESALARGGFLRPSSTTRLPTPARIAGGPAHAENGRGQTMSNIAERVKKIVVEHLGVEPEKVTESASFIDDLGADSLDTVELVMAFEEEFGCEIPDDAAETILTVGDAVKFLEKNAKS
jgi:acyl carrier protein